MGSTFTRTAASLTGALALTLGLVGAAGSAGASTPQAAAAWGCFAPSSTSVGDVCLYDGINRTTLIDSVDGNYNRRYRIYSRDRASSWRNYSTFRWCAYDDRTLLPDEYLFTLNPRSYSNWVGNYPNDRADYLEPCA